MKQRAKLVNNGRNGTKKFKGKGDINKCKNDAERAALQWLRVEMGWTLPEMEGNPLIYPNPWRNGRLGIL